MTAASAGGGMQDRPLIAVFAGPMATALNTPPLVAGALRPQRLAMPAIVYVERFSAHPLEDDAASLYGPPDGYLSRSREFSEAEPEGGGTAVYRVRLDPADGLYSLPYVARDARGDPWRDETTDRRTTADDVRQTFYPDAARLYEEIDRFGVDAAGRSGLLSELARFSHHRPASPAARRHTSPTPSTGEASATDYFPYAPTHLRVEASSAVLARLTNEVQQVLDDDAVLGAQWLEGSPRIEETLYWMSLLIDTTKPIVGHVAQRRHQTLGADGGRNVLDGVRYLVSRVWADEAGCDRAGPVLISDQLVYPARDVTKVAARPGGFEVTGGYGGPLGGVNSADRFNLTFVPSRRSTRHSQVNLSRLPESTSGVTASDGRLQNIPVPVTSGRRLLDSSMPNVVIVKTGRYAHGAEVGCEPADPGVAAWLQHNLTHHPLSGFVVEGLAGNGSIDRQTETLLARAVYSGLPVVWCAGGGPGDTVAHVNAPFVGGSNLAAAKARLLLMAALLREGALPPASDPQHPTADEVAATERRVVALQRSFDDH